MTTTLLEIPLQVKGWFIAAPFGEKIAPTEQILDYTVWVKVHEGSLYVSLNDSANRCLSSHYLPLPNCTHRQPEVESDADVLRRIADLLDPDMQDSWGS